MEVELQRVCGAAVYDELAAHRGAAAHWRPPRLTPLPMMS
jgi:hypothetical protein